MTWWLVLGACSLTEIIVGVVLVLAHRMLWELWPERQWIGRVGWFGLGLLVTGLVVLLGLLVWGLWVLVLTGSPPSVREDALSLLVDRRVRMVTGLRRTVWC